MKIFTINIFFAMLCSTWCNYLYVRAINATNNVRHSKLPIKTNTNSTKDLYQGVRKITNKFKPMVDTIKKEDGVMLCDGDEVKDRWNEYCSKLYQRNKNIPHNTVELQNNENEPPPLLQENCSEKGHSCSHLNYLFMMITRWNIRNCARKFSRVNAP